MQQRMPETAISSRLNDLALIRENLPKRLADREPCLSWINRWYILAFCFGPALFLAIAILALSGDVALMAGHMALALSTYWSLRLLSRRPLFNAVQGMVFLFHWWFSVGAVAVW